MNAATDTKKSIATQPAATAPAGTYMADAEAALKKVGVAFVNNDVRSWLEQEQADGTAIADLAQKWKAPENAALARETKYVSGLLYLTDELERMVARQNGLRDELAEKLQAAGVKTMAEVAADSAESLIATTAKVRAYVRVLKALESRMTADQPPEDIFNEVSQHTYSELAKKASNLSSRNTSWQENEQRLAEMVALGNVASLFIDVARI
jgi:hypothetical protein